MSTFTKKRNDEMPEDNKRQVAREAQSEWSHQHGSIMGDRKDFNHNESKEETIFEKEARKQKVSLTKKIRK